MRNKVLKGITLFMGFTAVMGMCMMDSDDITIPMIMVGAGLAWCLLFYFVNEEYIERRL